MRSDVLGVLGVLIVLRCFADVWCCDVCTIVAAEDVSYLCCDVVT